MSIGISHQLIIPITLWGKQPPTHCISSIYVTPNWKTLITGCNDGQICLWDLTVNLQREEFNIIPKCLLFGHSSSVLCITNSSLANDCASFVTSSESGEMCLWEISDGRCLETVKLQYVHTNIQTFHLSLHGEGRLFCNGYYAEILVINPLTLEIMFTLTSRLNPDWISGMVVMKISNKQTDDVVIGLSLAGVVKVWTITGNETRSSEPIYENEFKPIRCLNALKMVCCEDHQRTVLIVCDKYWQIYDAKDFSLLCSVSNPIGERWVNGDFISPERILITSDTGKGYMYKLTNNLISSGSSSSCIASSKEFHTTKSEENNPFLYCVLNIGEQERLLCPPITRLLSLNMQAGNKLKVLIRGDSQGKVAFWIVPNVNDRDLLTLAQELNHQSLQIIPCSSNSLYNAWTSMHPPPCGIMDRLFPEDEPDFKITASVYLPLQGRLVCGRENGSIVILTATQTILLQLLMGKHQSYNNWPQYQVLMGHSGKVNCLLYPYHVNSRYEIAHLLSGGVDFSVCLWDLYAGTLLHRFSVHAGEVTQLLVPPKDCNNRVLQSVCSLASDHSVALLNLKERKCVMLASRHLFPVHVIKWRPLEDFMIVGCVDGSVYVWQMETGLLDRVVQGLIAEEILNACDEHSSSTAGDKLTNPAIHLLRGLKSRNLAAIRHAAARGLHHLGGHHHQQQRDIIDRSIRERSHPLMIQGLKTNPKDQESHILFFDIESLIVNLLSEEYSNITPNTMENIGLTNNAEYIKYNEMASSPETQHKFSGFISKVKDSAENAAQRIHAKAESVGIKSATTDLLLARKVSVASSEGTRSGVTTPSGIKKPGKLLFAESNLTMELTQILLSLVHAWGLDNDLDRVCESKLGLLRPLRPICFGVLSKGGNMSLMLKSYLKKLDISENYMSQQNKQLRLKEQLPDDLHIELERAEKFTSQMHWELSPAITTIHRLSMVSLANTLMSMNSATFIPEQERKKKLYRKYSRSDSKNEIDVEDMKAFQAEAVANQQQQIKQGWSLLAALHCILLPDLVKNSIIKLPLVEILARRWQDRCLEIREAAQALLLAELRRIGPKGRKQLVDEWAPFLPQYPDNNAALVAGIESQQTHSHISPANDNQDQVQNKDGQDGGSDEEDADEEEGDTKSPHRRPSTFSESKRKQSTAIVLLGVVGSEYGHEIEHSKRKALEEPNRKKSIVDGFGPSNNSLARHTSHALTYLLLHPPTKSLPQHTSLRRAAIDLIGRGFTVWEPYLDTTKVLLELLELCCDSDRLVPSMSFGLPLTPQADSCRTARHALSLIATARPPAFITTLSKEVRRFNNLQQNAQSLNISLHNNVLSRAKPEILKNIELLIDKMPNDVSDLIVETMDIILHCLDSNHFKNKGLTEVFPAICSFTNVTYCSATRRIAVGSKTGQIAIYELKTTKNQVIAGHSEAVTCCAFSSDGKHLVSYSSKENKLCFWSTATALFGLGNSQTKCIRIYNTNPAPEKMRIVGNAPMARLVWVTNKSVILVFADGSEYRYSI